MMITDEEIQNITKVYNSLPYSERNAVQKKAIAAGLLVMKKTSQKDTDGSTYVTKSYTHNTAIEDELWYRSFVVCMTDVMIKRYIP